MAIIGVAKPTAALRASPVGAVLVANVVTADQYISIVLPGRMFSSAFAAHGADPLE